MVKEKVIQSQEADVDTLKCPKCGTLWRAKGYYNYDEGGWSHGVGDFCPNGCKNFFGMNVIGKIV